MSKRLGIVGGGQLGGFLAQAASDLSVRTTILTNNTEGVAAKFADEVLTAELDDLSAIDALIERSDVITFELENVPIQTLRRLAEQSKAKVYPDPSTMLLLQNKALQKDWLVDNGFLTSPHIRFDRGLDPSRAIVHLGANFVIKTQRGGYDGLGVKLVKNGNVPQGYETVPTIAEAVVKNFAEIAVLVARDAAGRCVHYPVFQSIFDAGGNVLRRVVCPAMVSEETARDAVVIACDIVDKLDGVGVFAVEYFLTDKELLVNEIAPRVHNVGHLTIEASTTSQFEQHVRAVMGMPLSSVVTVVPSVMDNLLYESPIAEACQNETTVQESEDVTVHWYGKHNPRPLRKMGHLTAISDSVEHALQLADRSLSALRKQV